MRRIVGSFQVEVAVTIFAKVLPRLFEVPTTELTLLKVGQSFASVGKEILHANIEKPVALVRRHFSHNRPFNRLLSGNRYTEEHRLFFDKLTDLRGFSCPVLPSHTETILQRVEQSSKQR